MRAILGVTLMGMMGLTALAADPDAKKLVGKWQIDKGDAKVYLDFTADGKVTMIGKVQETELKFTGTYKVEGEKLTVKMQIGGKEIARTLLIKKLDDSELVVEDDKAKTEKFSRAK